MFPDPLMTDVIDVFVVRDTELSQVDASIREILIPPHKRDASNWPVKADGTWPDVAETSS